MQVKGQGDLTTVPFGDGTRWRAGWYKLGKPPAAHLRAIVRVGRRNRSTPRSYVSIEEMAPIRMIPYSKVGRPAFPVERVKFSATASIKKSKLIRWIRTILFHLISLFIFLVLIRLASMNQKGQCCPIR